MHKKILSIATVLAVTATVASAPAHAADGRLEKIKSTGEIALGHRDTSIPFSYLDDKQQPIGYSMDICYGIVEALKTQLGMEKIDIKYVPVTSSTRITLVAHITVDIVCVSSTNTVERQVLLAYAP